MTEEKKLEGIIIQQPTTANVSVTASGPWGDEKKEFIYHETLSSANVTASLAYELGTTFKPDSEKQIAETIEKAKYAMTHFRFSLKLQGIEFEFDREPKKTIKFFTVKEK